MSLLILGIVIWSLIHFIPATAVTFRAGMVRRLGLPVYKGMFGLIALGALLLIIYGWKTASIEAVFAPPAWGVYVTLLTSLLAFVLFFAPYIENSFSRVFRHPQLTGVFVWGLGHLFYNGEQRSILLFGGFALWTIVQMWLLNRRDGSWTRPPAASLGSNIRLLLTGIGFFAIIMYTHSALFGVDPVWHM